MFITTQLSRGSSLGSVVTFRIKHIRVRYEKASIALHFPAQSGCDPFCFMWGTIMYPTWLDEGQTLSAIFASLLAHFLGENADSHGHITSRGSPSLQPHMEGQSVPRDSFIDEMLTVQNFGSDSLVEIRLANRSLL